MKINLKLKFDKQKIKYIFSTYRKFFLLALGVILIIIIASASLYGYKMYKISISIENRVEKIINAINLVSFVDMANFIDFRQLSLDMANSIMAHEKSTFPDSITATSLSESIQLALIAELTSTEEETEKVNVFTPFVIMPQGFFKQLTSTLKILESDDKRAIVEATIKYERTNTEVALKLQMENTESYGWRITNVINKKQIVEHFYVSKQIVRDRVIDFVTEKNNMIIKEMDEYFTINSCSAAITSIANSDVKLLLIEITGHNNGPYIIFNFNINTKYYNAKTEKFVDSFKVNLARRIFPNEKFSNVWTLEIEPGNAKHKILLDNLPLTCSAQFNNMGLSSGNVLYVNEIPAER